MHIQGLGECQTYNNRIYIAPLDQNIKNSTFRRIKLMSASEVSAMPIIIHNIIITPSENRHNHNIQLAKGVARPINTYNCSIPHTHIPTPAHSTPNL